LWWRFLFNLHHRKLQHWHTFFNNLHWPCRQVSLFPMYKVVSAATNTPHYKHSAGCHDRTIQDITYPGSGM
jgi:hypothetical protein